MNPSPGVRGGLSRWAARVTSSRFARPVARAALVAAAIVVLALIGYAATPRALGGSASAATADSAVRTVDPETRLAPSGAVLSPGRAASVPPPAPSAIGPAASDSSPAANIVTSPSRGAASPEDPVILNTATPDEFRRLPGIGEKRANAMLALRARLGRFRAIEDLLKVKGIGRATLKRLRPLVRLDPKTSPADGGDAPTKPLA